jgi:hypothetical protein
MNVKLPPGADIKQGLRRNTRTDRARHIFLDVLRQYCNVAEACRASGLARTTAYEWRAADPTFMAEWLEAEAEAVDKLEREAWRRGAEGYDETIVSGGKITVSTKYSDRMLEILLKGHRPDKYRERVSNEISGPGGGPVDIAFDPSALSDAAIAELMAARKRA